MLEPLPEKRITIKEIFEHPWMKNYSLPEEESPNFEEDESNISMAIDNMKKINLK